MITDVFTLAVPPDAVKVIGLVPLVVQLAPEVPVCPVLEIVRSCAKVKVFQKRITLTASLKILVVLIQIFFEKIILKIVRQIVKFQLYF
jgi:hypothetical protein